MVFWTSGGVRAARAVPMPPLGSCRGPQGALDVHFIPRTPSSRSLQGVPLCHLLPVSLRRARRAMSNVCTCGSRARKAALCPLCSLEVPTGDQGERCAAGAGLCAWYGHSPLSPPLPLRALSQYPLSLPRPSALPAPPPPLVSRPPRDPARHGNPAASDWFPTWKGRTEARHTARTPLLTSYLRATGGGAVVLTIRARTCPRCRPALRFRPSRTTPAVRSRIARTGFAETASALTETQ